jgi:serine/threonine protein kinase
LKPANLLVNQKNYTLKVADFGLAKAFSIPQKKCTPQVFLTIRVYIFFGKDWGIYFFWKRLGHLFAQH